MAEDSAEDYCFICKDGGLLVVCEEEQCLKAYHPECVGQDVTCLETKWICSWHKCFNCNKRSKFRCFCCPNSVCQACLVVAEFVSVKGVKGFCNNCLKLALLIEENREEDSDGGKLDLTDRETYEFLFKEYWEIVKAAENLEFEDLTKADTVLKKGRHCKEGFSGDNLIKPKSGVMSDDMEGKILKKQCRAKSKSMNRVLKRVPSKKREFIGWASKELLNFLTSLGKEVDEPMSQPDVNDIVMEYIREHGLICKGKKKKVACDQRLQPLFRRKVINRHKISDYLDLHFAENNDESLYESDDGIGEGLGREKRLGSKGEVNKLELKDLQEKAVEMYKNSYASIIVENIKLIYLKRSLVEKLLKDTEAFMNKIVGSFVRVKVDPNDRGVARNGYQLAQVTGVERTTEPYKIQEVITDNILRIMETQDVVKDVRISTISDDDFSQEECENLRKRVNEGLLERPTVGDIDRKARSLHEDITNHWVDRELVRLEYLIDRANEKGWRRELFEYLERKELLEMPEERSRLLKEPPKIVPDGEVEFRGTPCSSEGNDRTSDGFDEEREDQGDGGIAPQKSRKRGLRKGLISEGPEQKKKAAEAECEEVQYILQNVLQPPESDKHPVSSQEKLQAGWISLTDTAISGKELDLTTKLQEKHVIDLHDSDEDRAQAAQNPKDQIIDIDEDELGGDGPQEAVGQASEVSKDQWLYKDPMGVTQGPFPLRFLQNWSKQGFFDESFKVWRSHQGPNEAVLLTKVLNFRASDA